MPDREKVLKGLEHCIARYIDGLCDDCPYMGELDKSYMIPMKCKEIIMRDALELLKEQRWHDASVRPPREGRYLVWGLHEFTPDHCGEPNAYWQTRIAQWWDKYGWDVKVKFWMELPDVPNP